jgi:DNA processing protein
MKIRARDLFRLKELRESLLARKNPFESPARPGENLQFYDKFTKQLVVYSLKHVMPPDKLYFRGSDLRSLNSPLTVGFGGTVSPTLDGSQAAILMAQIATQMGGTVISGGVVGIDMMAHMGALDAGGKTIAVLANDVESGLHPYYPKRAFLENAIVQNGGFLSEYADHGNRFVDRLLQRDRIITGLSTLFVVVESMQKSATVDSAKRAYIQNRSVIAVDWEQVGNLWNAPKCDGNKHLLAEGIAKPFPSHKTSCWEEFAISFKKLLDHLT